MKAGLPWTRQDIKLLRALYPRLPTREVAARLRRSYWAVSFRACGLGLKKSSAYRHSKQVHLERVRAGRKGGLAIAGKPRYRTGWHQDVNRESNWQESQARQRYMIALNAIRAKKRLSSRAKRGTCFSPWNPSAESYASWLIRFREAQRPSVILSGAKNLSSTRGELAG